MREEKVRGGTDGARLSALGLPTPNLFTGGFDFHSRFEWNTVQNLTTAVGYVKSLLRLWSAIVDRAGEAADEIGASGGESPDSTASSGDAGSDALFAGNGDGGGSAAFREQRPVSSDASRG